MRQYGFQICLTALSLMLFTESAFANGRESQENQVKGNCVEQKAHQFAEKTKEVAHAIKETVEQKAHQLKKKADEAEKHGAQKAHHASEKTKEVAHNTKETVEQKAHQLKKKADEAKRNAEQKAHQAAEETKEGAHNAKETVERKAHQFAEKTKEVAHAVKETVEHKAHDMHVWSSQKALESAEEKALLLKKKADDAEQAAQVAAQHAKEVAISPLDNIAAQVHEAHVLSSEKAHEKAQQIALHLRQKADEAQQVADLAQQHAKKVASSPLDDHAQKAHEAHVWSSRKAQIRAERNALRLKEKAEEAALRAQRASEYAKRVAQDKQSS